MTTLYFLGARQSSPFQSNHLGSELKSWDATHREVNEISQGVWEFFEYIGVHNGEDEGEVMENLIINDVRDKKILKKARGGVEREGQWLVIVVAKWEFCEDMKIISYNIRGLGGAVKKKEVSQGNSQKLSRFDRYSRN